MRAVYIAIGNGLRRDDGAAHRVIELLGEAGGAAIRQVHQLCPEHAGWLAGMDAAVFLDASAGPGEARLDEIGPEDAAPSPLAHDLPPAAVAAIARKLFGFRGRAWLCRVPGADFGLGEGLSPQAEANAWKAAALLAAQPFA